MRAILHRADGSLRASRENAKIEWRAHKHGILDLNIRKIRRTVDRQVYLDRIIAGLQQTKLDLVLLPGFDAGALRFLMHHLIAIIEVYCRAVVIEVHLNAAIEPVDIRRLEAEIEAIIPAARPHILILETVHRIKFHRRVVAADREAVRSFRRDAAGRKRRGVVAQRPVRRIRQHIRHVDHVVGGFGIRLRNDDLAGLFNGRGCVIARTKVEVARGVCQHGIGIDLIEPFLAVYLEHHAQLVGRNLAEAERHVIGLAVFQREITLGNCAVVRVTLCIEHRLVRLKGNHHAAGLVP